ncbi:MAG: hypothetical protein GF372_14455, partial [Candidatus Marinimicrobia bacterium]|nr:hypothetical protein [Candidatus Neomarinimicrobiota bacterium]
MKRPKLIVYFGITLSTIFILWSCSDSPGEVIEYTFPENISRPWIGPEFYANRLQDWQLSNGRIECIESAESRPMRVVHLLTHALKSTDGSLRLSVEIGPVESGATDENTWAGFLIGAGGEDIDYRLTALVHHKPAEDGGLFAGIDGTGQIIFRDNSNGGGENNPWSIAGPLRENDMPRVASVSASGDGFNPNTFQPVRLELTAEPADGAYQVTISAYNLESDDLVSQATAENIPPEQLEGSIALASHLGPQESDFGYWFD